MQTDRFKVRMYDKMSKKMWTDENDCFLETTFECLKQQIAFDSNNEMLKKIGYNHTSLVFMQCTGLKDIEENLIYEGDIVRDCDNDLYRVFFHETLCYFVVQSYTKGYYMDLVDVKDAKIVGNIYEDKEIVEGVKNEM